MQVEALIKGQKEVEFGGTGPPEAMCPLAKLLGLSEPHPPGKCSLSTHHVPSSAKGPEDAAVRHTEPAPWTLQSGLSFPIVLILTLARFLQIVNA